MPRFTFITHTDVVVDPDVPAREWELSEQGRDRMMALALGPILEGGSFIFASAEPKAAKGARILAETRSKPLKGLEDLGEVDRSEAGFMERDAFDGALDAFFADPWSSAAGWERAGDAEERIVRAVLGIALDYARERELAIVSHGTVGALMMAHIKGEQASRAHMQPTLEGKVGGNYFVFDVTPLPVEKWRLIEDWQSIDIA